MNKLENMEQTWEIDIGALVQDQIQKKLRKFFLRLSLSKSPLAFVDRVKHDERPHENKIEKEISKKKLEVSATTTSFLFIAQPNGSRFQLARFFHPRLIESTRKDLPLSSFTFSFFPRISLALSETHPPLQLAPSLLFRCNQRHR